MPSTKKILLGVAATVLLLVVAALVANQVNISRERAAAAEALARKRNKEKSETQRREKEAAQKQMATMESLLSRLVSQMAALNEAQQYSRQSVEEKIADGLKTQQTVAELRGEIVNRTQSTHDLKALLEECGTTKNAATKTFHTEVETLKGKLATVESELDTVRRDLTSTQQRLEVSERRFQGAVKRQAEGVSQCKKVIGGAAIVDARNASQLAPLKLGIVTVHLPYQTAKARMIAEVVHRSKVRLAANSNGTIDYISVNSPLGSRVEPRSAANLDILDRLQPYLATNHTFGEDDPVTTLPYIETILKRFDDYDWFLLLEPHALVLRTVFGLQTDWLRRRAFGKEKSPMDAIVPRSFSGVNKSGAMFIRSSSAMKATMQQILAKASEKASAGNSEGRVSDLDVLAYELKLNGRIQHPSGEVVSQSKRLFPKPFDVLVLPVMVATTECTDLESAGDDCPEVNIVRSFPHDHCDRTLYKVWEHIRDGEPSSEEGVRSYPFSHPINGASAMSVLFGIINLKRLESSGILTGATEFEFKRNAARKIAILCVTAGNAQDVALRAMRLASKWNKEQYAERHGYDLIWEDSEGSAVPPRTRHWAKLGALAKWLPHYEWVWWIDVDTVIMNFNVTLESLIVKATTINHGIEPAFVAARDGLFLNTGSFLLRNTAKSYHFLGEIWNSPESKWQYWEQGAFNYVAVDDPVHSRVYGAVANFTTILNASDFNALPPNWWVAGVAYQPGDFLVHFPDWGGQQERGKYWYEIAMDASARANGYGRWPTAVWSHEGRNHRN